MADIKKINVGGTEYTLDADKVDGKHASDFATSSHTHAFSSITSRGESFLSWGGQNFSGSYGPIDAAMIDSLGANRSQFIKPAGVEIKYSTDGGSSWADYGATDAQKIGLFSNIGQSFVVGKATTSAPATANSKLRIFINTSAANIYTVLNKFAIYLSTSGSNGCTCSIDARLQSNYEAGTETWVNFANKVSVSGWSGWNIINTSGITTYGNTKTSQYGQIRFTFEITGGSTSYAGLSISKIMCFGGVGWTTPSTMASTGLIYSYDASQNTTFPAQVAATSFKENGTLLSAKYAAKGSATGSATPGTDSQGGHSHSVTINTYSATGATTVTGVSGSTTASKATAGTARKIGNANVGTAIACDDITAWTTNTPTVLTVNGTCLEITAGSAASLSYTARSIAPATTSSDTITPYTFADVTVPKAATSATSVISGITAGTTTATTDTKGAHTHTVNSHTHTQN